MKLHSFTYVAIIMMILALTTTGCAPKPGDQAQELATTNEAGGAVQDTGDKHRMNPEAAKGVQQQGTQQAGQAEKTGLENIIYFDFDQAELKSESVQVLNELINFMKANEGMNIQISGHCDERGTSEYNMALGDRRAKAGKEYCIKQGIDEKRISTISYGEEKPIDPASNEDAWAKNRRDEFQFSK